MAEIIVWPEDEKFFILIELETISFHNHFMEYEVERTENRAVDLRHDLLGHIIQKNGKKFIVEKDSSCIQDTLKKKEFFILHSVIACIYDLTMHNTKAQNPHVI